MSASVILSLSLSRTLRVAAWLALSLAWAAPAAAQGGSSAPADEWIPEGFESLAAPQQTLVDVYYGGIFLQSVPARFTATEITLLDAQPIADRLSDLSDPDSFVELMEFTQRTNSELICKSKFSVDCGQLSTPTVGIIFDRSRLRADLFIGPELLAVRSAEQINFLPGSDGGLSLLDDIAVYASGSSDSDTSYNVANTTLLAYAENRLNIQSNYTEEEDFTIDTLALERERNGLDYRLGAFRANAGSFVFMQNEEFVGATVESSLVTRDDLELSLGSKLVVFLNSRSLVQLYRDDRLLGSTYYDTGNQELDTSSLPAGSYEVEIRIIDSAGRTRIERQFYSKSSRIPPRDQPLYFVQAGKYAQTTLDSILPEVQDETFLRSGFSWRMSDAIATSLGVSVNDSSTMLETGIFNQGQSYELSASFAGDEFSRLGADVRFRYRYEQGDISFYGRHTAGGDVDEDEESQLGEELSQVNISAGLRTDFGSWGAFLNYTDDKEQDSKRYGLRWTLPTYFNRGSWTSDIELSSNDGDALFLVNVRYSQRGGRWTNSAAAEYSHTSVDGSNSESDFNGYAATGWQSDIDQATQYRFNARADHRDTDSVETSGEMLTNSGNAGINLKHDFDTNVSQYNGSLRSSFAISGSGMGLGGKRTARSGLLVSVEGSGEEQSRIKVLANGAPQTSILAGSRVFVPLAPYNTYEIELLPEGDSIVNIDYRTRSFTLYPGNVVSIDAALKKVLITIGRATNASGEPIRNALVEGVEGLALTDDNGYFQAEIAAGTAELSVVKGDARCVIDLPELDVNRPVLSLGSLPCRPTP